jgi:hypothetical protein
MIENVCAPVRDTLRDESVVYTYSYSLFAMQNNVQLLKL